MPPIALWPSLAVTGGFALAFTAGAVLSLLERRRNPQGPARWLVLNTALAILGWALVYRIFFPS